VAGLSGTSGEAGAAQRVLDPEAIAEYRSRLKRLDTEIDELEPERARQARAERDWLVAQLSSAAGFGGRTRAFPDQPERARVAVGKAIRRALARITEADAVIGEHLRQTVHTGVTLLLLARLTWPPGDPAPRSGTQRHGMDRRTHES
jgi:hypothetical protein